MPFRNPGLIAWIANTIDEVSAVASSSVWAVAGRRTNFRAFDFQFDRRVSYFAESLEVILPLLRHGEADFQGKFVEGRRGARPPGPRAGKGGPPILIAARKPRMVSLVAKHADRWNSVWYGLPTDEFRAERRNVEQACAAIGRDPKEIEVSAGLQVSERRWAGRTTSSSCTAAPNQIADGLGKWRDEGVTEVMCRMEPAVGRAGQPDHGGRAASSLAPTIWA